MDFSFLSEETRVTMPEKQYHHLLDLGQLGQLHGLYPEGHTCRHVINDSLRPGGSQRFL